jgi:hypothetical protein
MKRMISAFVIAVGVGGLVASSHAEDVKKLQPHPDAAADLSLRQGTVNVASPSASYPGGASADYAKPATGDAVASGGTSTSAAASK